MRENRLYGSEGGEAKSLPYPYHLSTRWPADRSQNRRRSGSFNDLLRQQTRRAQIGGRAAAEPWIASLRSQ
jgi:hypothetical protein